MSKNDSYSWSCMKLGSEPIFVAEAYMLLFTSIVSVIVNPFSLSILLKVGSNVPTSVKSLMIQCSVGYLLIASYHLVKSVYNLFVIYAPKSVIPAPMFVCGILEVRKFLT